MEAVVDLCEHENLDLKIKLHPRGSEQWYAERGWKSYIGIFGDIDTALQQTRIAITDVSSAFVESSVYGTPIVVADIQNQQLSSLAPVQNVQFPETLDDLPSEVRDALNGDPPQTDNSVVETGGSIGGIISATRAKRDIDCS